jgi:hypothetical protein
MSGNKPTARDKPENCAIPCESNFGIQGFTILKELQNSRFGLGVANAHNDTSHYTRADPTVTGKI